MEEGGRTALMGRLIDQSQLVGIINHLHAPGIVIASFEVTDDQ